MLDGKEYHIGKVWLPMECLRCGICCTRYQPPLTPEEVETIAKGLGLSPGDFLSKYVQITVAGYLLRQTEKGCVFLKWEEGEATANCDIYPFRPDACRNWVASLSRRECQEGLKRLKAEDKTILAHDLYTSLEAIERTSQNGGRTGQD